MKKQIRKILVVNCGSSSLKYMLFDMKGEKMLAKGLVERIGIAGPRLVYAKTGCEKIVREIKAPNHVEAIKAVMAALVDPKTGVVASLKEIDAIGHRVVHGADKFAAPVKITSAVKKQIEKCAVLAPLHNPANLDGITACEKACPGVPNVGVFDTAFHQTMPACAYRYAIPRKLADKYMVRKYGFHGTSHMFLTQAAAQWLKKPVSKVNLVTCHLGNGSSIAAVKNGQCMDTTMGLTPLDGLVMGTRSGTIDPGAIFYLAKAAKMDLASLDKMLNKESGFQGLSGKIGGDSRDVCAGAAAGDIDCVEAQETFGHRAALFVGGYNTLIGGADAIVMAGGIGENSAECREQILKRLAPLGVKLDKAANKKVRGCVGVISAKGSKIPVVVIPTNEELMIARQTLDVLK